MSEDDEKNTSDLSSLISLPSEPSEDGAGDPFAVSMPPSSDEPMHFESLEELSQKEIPEHPDASSEVETPAVLEQPAFDQPALEISADPLAAVSAPTATEIPAPAPPSLDSIKSFSENLATPVLGADAQVAAAYPFTLKIDGKLKPEEAEKLLTLLSRENMGFREVDLETQIAEGRILIPRISEYAGVLLVQALRGVSATIQFGPSDEIFSTPETRSDFVDLQQPWTQHDENASLQQNRGLSASAEEMPVTNADSLPQFLNARVIDTVISSGLLSTRSVEAQASEEYTRLLEALIRELKFKAKRRGANGIVSLQISLAPLTLPTDYRVTVTGSAVAGS